MMVLYSFIILLLSFDKALAVSDSTTTDELGVEVIEDKKKMSSLIDRGLNTDSAMPMSSYDSSFSGASTSSEKRGRIVIPKGTITASSNAKANKYTNRFINDAYKAFQAGNTELALHLYQSALTSNPDNLDALFGTAVALQLLGQTDEAMDKYVKILDKDPDNISAKNNLLTLIAGKSIDKAITELEKINKNKPDQSFILAQIGTLYSHQGNYSNAVTYLGKAIELEPSNPYYVYNMAVTLDKMGKYKDAYMYYDSALGKINPGINLDANVISDRMQNIKYKSSL